MTQNTTFPPHLINGFKKLADDFEAHIRADERKRIAAKFRAEFPTKPVAKPGLFPVTDLQGKPGRSATGSACLQSTLSLCAGCHAARSWPCRPWPVIWD